MQKKYSILRKSTKVAPQNIIYVVSNYTLYNVKIRESLRILSNVYFSTLWHFEDQSFKKQNKKEAKLSVLHVLL